MRLNLLAASLSTLLVLSACSALSDVKDLRVDSHRRQIKVVAQVSANQDMATALDVVFVFDPNALLLLPKTGPDWFANKTPLLASFSSGLSVASLQIPPASTIAQMALPKGHEKAIAVYSYANYLSEAGQAAGNLTPYRCVLINLATTQVYYTNCN
jgi:type VI secretion system protein